MTRMKRSVIHGLAACCLVVLVFGAVPASATQLVDFTIEANAEVYEVGEFVGVIGHAYNAGDEVLEFGSGAYRPPAAVWAFENAAGLSRDDLLGEQEPISTRSLSICTYDYPLSPGETLTHFSGAPFLDDMGNPIGPGQYTLLGVGGPYPESWEGATVDYSAAYADITIVPEPGTLCLLAAAAAAGLLRKGKRRGR